MKSNEGEKYPWEDRYVCDECFNDVYERDEETKTRCFDCNRFGRRATQEDWSLIYKGYQKCLAERSKNRQVAREEAEAARLAAMTPAEIATENAAWEEKCRRMEEENQANLEREMRIISSDKKSR